ncbi:rhomboid family intramembrane serine protease [Pelotomaculum terephthalicicum JT]|uniref:rhomboid family intramembrane serine protease n=1 Tax=Pelotomaculum TaxID=191373 RepID=UPI0009D14C80|nr:MULTISPECIES: rhomboid family intramembrane serine protease [Pelotomaculum]MCG9967675.1 rhomboid family intramembrane serine protease [Pelotomaculum terephthalicicum JT]OPX84031.1 MAG: Rhomboid protease GluP [Pelotomaculum sp. PtaB.Bin117]OPY61493.1 MAG: Rhomboid protease GluP [Pelotomaculum sp. PtaU1.Bin065]
MLLIIINLAVFGYEVYLGRYLDEFIFSHAVIPIQLSSVGMTADQLVRLTTAMFLHGGWFHVLSNMLYLWIFGDNVEDRMGHFRYLVFYLLTGYIATIAHIFYYPFSNSPLIGASGAIAGILGAYLILYPRAKVLTLVFLFIFIQIIPIPAVIFLGLWFVLQILSGVAGLTDQTAQGVAFWAHIGGFIAGILLVKLFSRSKDRDYVNY